MTDPDLLIPPPAPKPVRAAVAVVSALVALTMVGGIGVALFGFPKTAWAFLGFEVVGVVAAVLGVLTGLGRFRSGFGMSTLCVAGTFVAGALFGLYLDARVNATSAQGTRLVWAMIAFRIGAAALVVGLGGLAVLMRDRRSWRVLGRGVLFLIPVFAVLGWLGVTKFRPLTMPLDGVWGPVRIVCSVLGGLALMVLFSIGAHLCIRAFEITRPDDRPEALDAAGKQANGAA